MAGIGYWPISTSMAPFEKALLDNAQQISRLNRSSGRGSMTMPKNDKYKDYARYAERCLVTATTDQESGYIQREMAAEWLRLADANRRPKQMQMG